MTAIQTPLKLNLSPDNSDDAVQLLNITARFHAARGDSAAWRATLIACRDWFHCDGALGEVVDSGNCDLGPDEFDSLAGRVTHCATYGIGTCAHEPDNALKRLRCSALAPHLHEAANLARKDIQASVFNQLPATWILTRRGKIREANANARAITEQADQFAAVEGYLSPTDAAGARLLARTLPVIQAETPLTWSASQGEVNLILRTLPNSDHVSASLAYPPQSTEQIARILQTKFGLHTRQSQLAGHLVEGLSLTDTAKVMGISRNTANDHLCALTHRLGVSSRKELVLMCRHATQR